MSRVVGTPSITTQYDQRPVVSKVFHLTLQISSTIDYVIRPKLNSAVKT